MSVFHAGDNEYQKGVQGNSKEYRKGAYIYQVMSDPMAGYQQSKGYRNGIDADMQTVVKDKKLTFIPPTSVQEKEDWLDKIIDDISKLNKKEYADLLAEEIEYLLNLLIPVLEQEPIIIEVEAPVTIAGDTHGQLSDLFRFFNQIGPPPHKKYLFQGDYVDRNPNDVEVITLLFAYKLRFPGYVNMLRGNHECRMVNQIYGFKDSCKRIFEKDGLKLWKKFCQAFQNLPVCALIDEKILCMHGGISQKVMSLDALRKTKKPENIPDDGMLCDLLWADPEKNQRELYEFNSSRGVGVTFNEKAVENICNKLDIDLISRSHQVVEDGYEFFADRRLVTIFSAPGYMGDFDNDGAMMDVDETLMCKFIKVKCERLKPNLLQKKTTMGNWNQGGRGGMGRGRGRGKNGF